MRGEADHPRSRGVYTSSGMRRRMTPGSSPLARGLPPSRKVNGVTSGIIPARAGFTSHHHRQHPCSTDHPRSRGVYHRRRRSSGDLGGSSPLARGLPRRARNGALLQRIIPARAGFTRTVGPPVPVRRDHPRSRGVYPRSRTAVIGDLGSSPLARGLLDKVGYATDYIGIIPARAGFTL